jgi:ethanolamine utilization cobalamin adenosyltransferase
VPIGRDGDGERTGFSDFSVRAETPGEHLTRSPRPHRAACPSKPVEHASDHAACGSIEEEKVMSKNNWKAGLRAKLEQLVDDCVVAGARQQDVFDAIIKEIGNLRAALERDPDPADDDVAVIEEPANDWPAADR